MTAAHLHLIAVHVPVVLMPLALILLGLGAWRDRASSFDDRTASSAATLRATGRWLIVASGIAGAAAYFSGPIAFEALDTELESVRDLVESHAVIGRAVFFGLILLAVPTLQAILREFEEEAPSRRLNAVVIVGAALLSYLLLWTGHLGGAIRRPDILGAFGWLFPKI